MSSNLQLKSINQVCYQGIHIKFKTRQTVAVLKPHLLGYLGPFCVPNLEQGLGYLKLLQWKRALVI